MTSMYFPRNKYRFRSNYTENKGAEGWRILWKSPLPVVPSLKQRSMEELQQPRFFTDISRAPFIPVRKFASVAIPVQRFPVRWIFHKVNVAVFMIITGYDRPGCHEGDFRSPLRHLHDSVSATLLLRSVSSIIFPMVANRGILSFEMHVNAFRGTYRVQQRNRSRRVVSRRVASCHLVWPARGSLQAADRINRKG